MLSIRELETGYGKKQVLFSLSMEVRDGEIVALIGPNGAGKSTILKAICGLIPIWKGEIYFNSTSTKSSTPAENVARGITFAPQGNRVFDELSVRENLEIGGFQLEPGKLNERIHELFQAFPVLGDRRHQEAGKLSGGERQMLALARALVAEPKLLVLDEPSLGLSPGLVNDVFERISQANRDTGIAVLIVEQKVREVLNICHRVYSVKLGRVAFAGDPDELRENRDRLRQLFLWH